MLTHSDYATIQQMLDAHREKMATSIADKVLEGVARLMAEAGLSTSTISQTQAYALYGRRTVEGWVYRGWVRPYSDGPHRRRRYSIAELAKAEKNNNQKNRNNDTL